MATDYKIVVVPYTGGTRPCIKLVLYILCIYSLFSRTQLGKHPESQTNQVYDTPALPSYYVSVGNTPTPAMELSQCPAYASTDHKVSTSRGRRGDEAI